MVETSVPLDPVVLAVIATLDDALTVSIGDHQAPADPDPEFPYSTVYLIPDADRSGPMNDGQADVVHNIQVTSVGETRQQAQALADDVNVAMRDETTPPNPASKIVIAGREVSLVEIVFDGSIERDDGFQPPVFYAVQIFDITTTPA